MAHIPYDTMEPDQVTAIDLDELMLAVERCAGARVKDEIRITVLANAPDGPPSYGAVLTDATGERSFRGTGVIPDVLAWLLENREPGKPNLVVEYLLDHGGLDMNRLAVQGFPQADREQFAQLIGYSVDGFAELSYASEEAVKAAYREAWAASARATAAKAKAKA